MLAETCLSITLVVGEREGEEEEGENQVAETGSASGHGIHRPRFGPPFSLLLRTFAAPRSKGKHVPSCKTWFVLLPLYLLSGRLRSRDKAQACGCGRFPPVPSACSLPTSTLPAPLHVPALTDALPLLLWGKLLHPCSPRPTSPGDCSGRPSPTPCSGHCNVFNTSA